MIESFFYGFLAFAEIACKIIFVSGTILWTATMYSELDKKIKQLEQRLEQRLEYYEYKLRNYNSIKSRFPYNRLYKKQIEKQKIPQMN